MEVRKLDDTAYVAVENGISMTGFTESQARKALQTRLSLDDEFEEWKEMVRSDFDDDTIVFNSPDQQTRVAVHCGTGCIGFGRTAEEAERELWYRIRVHKEHGE